MSEKINNDAVNPQHYKKGSIEVADFIADQRLNFFEGNVVKYVARHQSKAGLQDLKKAAWYLNYLISNYAAIFPAAHQDE